MNGLLLSTGAQKVVVVRPRCSLVLSSSIGLDHERNGYVQEMFAAAARQVSVSGLRSLNGLCYFFCSAIKSHWLVQYVLHAACQLSTVRAGPVNIGRQRR